LKRIEFEQQNGFLALNRYDFSSKTEKLTERNLKMNNYNKTENISDFANHYGLRVETDRFLAPNCKAKTGNNAHKKLLIFN